jgi:hypothetical protein
MMTTHDDGMRTIIDLPDEQISALAALCRRDGMSRAEAIRQAVERFTRAELPRSRDEAFGLWRERAVDGLDYERPLREEW